ncbi:putative insecticidal toxin [Pandoraea iniqua]|nr:putative insecticidal toxin [Pandoraea iniqua]
MLSSTSSALPRASVSTPPTETTDAPALRRSVIARRFADELEGTEAALKPERGAFAIRFEGGEVPVRRDLAYDLWYARHPDGTRQYFANEGVVDKWFKRAAPTPGTDPVMSAVQQRYRLKRMGYRFAAHAMPLPPVTVRTPLPRVAHTVWLGGRMPVVVFANLARLARSFEKASPAFAVQLHVMKSRVQSPALHQQLDGLPNVTVKVLAEEPFFRAFAASPSFAMFRELTAAKYWSAPHDAVRYRVLQAFGGILFDPRDKFRFGPPTLPETLALADVAVSGFIVPPHAYQYSPLHVGIMASLPGNPVIEAINDNMWHKWQEMTGAQAPPHYREWLCAPTQAPEAWLARTLSELCGPHLVTHVLYDWVPGIRTMVDMMKANEDGIEIGGNARPEYAALMDYYFAFDKQLAAVASADDRQDVIMDLALGVLARSG